MYSLTIVTTAGAVFKDAALREQGVEIVWTGCGTEPRQADGKKAGEGTRVSGNNTITK